jgi:hypothetical protein
MISGSRSLISLYYLLSERVLAHSSVGKLPYSELLIIVATTNVVDHGNQRWMWSKLAQSVEVTISMQMQLGTHTEWLYLLWNSAQCYFSWMTLISYTYWQILLIMALEHTCTNWYRERNVPSVSWVEYFGSHRIIGLLLRRSVMLYL